MTEKLYESDHELGDPCVTAVKSLKIVIEGGLGLVHLNGLALSVEDATDLRDKLTAALGALREQA